MKKTNGFARGRKNPLIIRTRGVKRPTRILIVTEGAETERNYFESFRIHGLDIKVIGEGANTVSLVRQAIEYKESARRMNEPYDHSWVVFDRDSFPKENVEAAFVLAKTNDIECAFSNEAFELWFLLHFGYRDTGMSRVEYEDALTKRLGFKYSKNSPKIFDALLPKMGDAINHAQRLSKNYVIGDNYSDRNPFTSVYELVTFLLKKTK